MISKDKTYRTRDGREVRIYATDGSHPFVIHGAYRVGPNWIPCSWLYDGFYSDDRNLDLIEVKPRIKRTVWLNVEAHCAQSWASKEDADRWPKRRLACVKVEIDCEEGEGL